MSQTSSRLLGIDILRGLIIVLMALDHTRDFWGAAGFNPTDLTKTDGFYFFTRWVTHFCAPLFVFLTGVSAFLYGQKIQNKSQLRNYLLSRGVWMIVLELTVVNLSWQFGYGFAFVQVIWAIGWSMIILAGLIYIPSRWILLITVPFLLGHNLLNDAAMVEAFGQYKWLYQVFHTQAWIPITAVQSGIYVTYPILPWFSVMALGYVMGQWYIVDAQVRQKQLMQSGLLMIVGFIVLRATGIYGDPNVFEAQDSLTMSIVAFFNTTKYPASLQFLLMTIGPGLVLLSLIDNVTEQSSSYKWMGWLRTFGAVPLFFYVIHVPLINISAHLYTYLVYGKAVNFFYGKNVYPQGYEPNLLLAYAAWIVIVVALYIPCKYYGRLKRRSKNVVLSYL